MIKNTKTAEWAAHIAFTQAVAAELYAAHVAGLGANAVKRFDDAITARAKSALNETALALAKIPNNPQANAFAKELVDGAERMIADNMAAMKAPAAKDG